MKDKRLLIGLIIGIVCAIIYLIGYEIYDFYHDYQCSTMPFSEMIQNHSCDKYWRDK